jgi:hypothetical protein
MPYMRSTLTPDKETEERPDVGCSPQEPLWALYADDGAVILSRENRSQIFFYVTENDMTLHSIQ